MRLGNYRRSAICRTVIIDFTAWHKLMPGMGLIDGFTGFRHTGKRQNVWFNGQNSLFKSPRQWTFASKAFRLAVTSTIARTTAPLLSI